MKIIYLLILNFYSKHNVFTVLLVISNVSALLRIRHKNKIFKNWDNLNDSRFLFFFFDFWKKWDLTWMILLEEFSIIIMCSFGRHSNHASPQISILNISIRSVDDFLLCHHVRSPMIFFSLHTASLLSFLLICFHAIRSDTDKWSFIRNV